jgi:hypothetical protein
VISGLLEARRPGPAIAEADAFASRFHGEARADDVALLRAHALRQRGGLAEAREGYLALAESARTAAVAAEARYFAGVAAWQLGRRSEARVSWEEYRARHPRGPRSAELEKLLRN